jgi:ankyrin repeat protein
LIAASWGHTEICSLLLEKGADIEATDKVGGKYIGMDY